MNSSNCVENRETKLEITFKELLYFSVASTPIRGSHGYKIYSSVSNDSDEKSNNEADQDSPVVDKPDHISHRQDKISHQTSDGSLVGPAENKTQTLKSFVYDILENPETSKVGEGR